MHFKIGKYVSTPERIGVAVMLALVLPYYVLGWWMGFGTAMPVGYYTTLYQTTFDAIIRGVLDIPVQVPAFLLEGKYISKGLVLAEWPNLWFLVVLLVAYTLLFTVCSYIEGIYAYIALALVFALFIIGQTESVGIGGVYEKWTDIAVGLLFSGTVFWFQAFRPLTRFLLRWVVFFTFLVFYFLLVVFAGHLQSPLYTWVNTAFWLFPVASIVFVLLNGADAQLWLLKQIASRRSASGNLVPFIIFSVFFSANSLWTYLNNTGTLHSDLITVSPFLIFIISGFAGLVVAEEKQHHWQLLGISSSLGWLLQQMLFTLSAVGVGYAFWSGADMWIEVYEDIFSLGYFCMSAIFLLYMLINFGGMLREGLAIYIVVFKPRYMPYTAVSIFALTGMWIFVLNASYFPYYQAISGQYLLKADAALKEGNHLLAESLLNTARSFEYRNHRTNFTLGWLSKVNGHDEQALQHFKDALSKKALPQTYLCISDIAAGKGNLLEAALVLKEGITAFPDDKMLHFNLGLTYGKLNFIDSAQHYLSKAQELGVSNAHILGTQIFLSALKGWDIAVRPEGVQSIRKDPAAWNNLLFEAMRQGKTMPTDELPNIAQGDLKDDEWFALAYNLQLYRALNAVQNTLANTLAYDNDERKHLYLQFVSALQQYFSGQKLRAIKQLAMLSDDESEIMHVYAGIQAAEGNWEEAQNTFAKLWAGGNFKVLESLALAYAVNARAEKSAQIWELIINLPTPTKPPVTKNLIRVLQQQKTDEIDILLDYEQWLATLALRHQLPMQYLVAKVKQYGNHKQGLLLVQLLLSEYLQMGKTDEAVYILQSLPSNVIDNNIVKEAQVFLSYQLKGPSQAAAQAESWGMSQWAQLLKASLATDTTVTYRIYADMAEQQPFHIWLHHIYIQHLLKAGYFMAAYNQALKVLDLLPTSYLANRDYLQVCIANGLDDFANQRLKVLSEIFSKPQVEELRQALESYSKSSYQLPY